ncbi:3-hydroxyacyl-ACP dehydratase FabZ family protein [Desulfobacula sp.]|uniref:3-hydroxyacyl-ACP dehydratase FabZ family protein n=1 Tax=Desulfobacula sp. TaxID=2593537 RepID=UPI002614385E|nr:3-hydroxyacyl-ACP dehydratase FabZ family protein [Desulfobacula sp.]
MTDSVDDLREIDGSISREDIKKIIPYGDPFLFVDKVIHLDKKEIEASFHISKSLSFIPAHFVGFPVIPAAILTEGFGQSGTILIRYNIENHDSKEILIYRTEDARFFSPVFPDKTVCYKVGLKNLSNRAARLEGVTYVNNKKIASFRLLMTILDRTQFHQMVI